MPRQPSSVEYTEDDDAVRREFDAGIKFEVKRLPPNFIAREILQYHRVWLKHNLRPCKYIGLLPQDVSPDQIIELAKEHEKVCEHMHR